MSARTFADAIGQEHLKALTDGVQRALSADHVTVIAAKDGETLSGHAINAGVDPSGALFCVMRAAAILLREMTAGKCELCVRTPLGMFPISGEHEQFTAEVMSNGKNDQH